MSSQLETTFAVYMHMLAPDLAARMVEQYPVGPGRKFRFDFAFVHERLGIELQGGLYSGGSHARPAGILRDMTKLNFATLHGWRVLQYATQHIEDDPMTVIAEIRAVIEAVEDLAP